MTNPFKWLKNAWAREDLFKDAVCLPRLWLILQLVWNLNTCSSLAKRSSSTFACFWCFCVWSAVGWLNQAQSIEHISQDVFWTCPDSSIPRLALEIKYDRGRSVCPKSFWPQGWVGAYYTIAPRHCGPHLPNTHPHTEGIRWPSNHWNFCVWSNPASLLKTHWGKHRPVYLDRQFFSLVMLRLQILG